MLLFGRVEDGKEVRCRHDRPDLNSDRSSLGDFSIKMGRFMSGRASRSCHHFAPCEDLAFSPTCSMTRNVGAMLRLDGRNDCEVANIDMEKMDDQDVAPYDYRDNKHARQACKAERQIKRD